MDADADVNLLGGFFLAVVRVKQRLNLLGTLYRMNHGGEVHQKGVPDGLDHCPMMLSDRSLDKLVMRVQPPQHAGLIASHLATKAHDIREHDRRQPPILGLYRAAGVFLHGYELFCWPCLAVNRSPVSSGVFRMNCKSLE